MTAFVAAPTVLGVIDTYGIELIHPIREDRSPQQIGRKGVSNHRWIVGGKRCLVLNQWGFIVARACATATVADNTFQGLIRQFEERMIILMAQEFSFFVFDMKAVTAHMGNREESHSPPLLRCP